MLMQNWRDYRKLSNDELVDFANAYLPDLDLKQQLELEMWRRQANMSLYMMLFARISFGCALGIAALAAGATLLQFNGQSSWATPQGELWLAGVAVVIVSLAGWSWKWGRYARRRHWPGGELNVPERPGSPDDE